MSVVYSDSASAKVNALIKQKSTTAALWGAIRAGDFNKIEQAMKSIQHQTDLLLELVLAVVSTGDRIQVTDGTGKPVAIIGQLDGDKFGIHATDAYFGGTLGDTSSAGVVIEDGTVTASGFQIWQPVLLDELVLTSNSPAAGRIAWGATRIQIGPTIYTISSGNTSSSTHKHVYWVKGDSAFTTATEMPADEDNYLIATNSGGTADLAIGKTGAGKSITEDALVPSLLKGIAIQPVTQTSKSVTTISTTTLLNVTSGGGALLGIYCFVETAITSGTAMNLYLDITVDGETEQSLTLIIAPEASASDLWNSLSNVRSGNMSANGDYRNMSVLAMAFAESILVEARTTGSGASTGLIRFNVVYGLKTAA